MRYISNLKFFIWLFMLVASVVFGLFLLDYMVFHVLAFFKLTASNILRYFIDGLILLVAFCVLTER